MDRNSGTGIPVRYLTKLLTKRSNLRCMIQKTLYICGHKVAQPTVFIPVFPGTNCEYDSAKAFERAGAEVITKVFRNMDAADIRRFCGCI